jgi:23S rRNA (cytidine1920-2'-O)/16S rRNA (cytidine1409-2'-O)-methyltransferase
VTKRDRLDQKLVMLGLAESRTAAQRLVMAGEVRVNGEVADKASRAVGPDDELTVDAQPAFVSRGGDKLAAALAAFPVSVAGRVCADVGASTGGFTDCLLQAGAGRVYAIDVGHGILHWRLRTDPRVIVMERTNARHLETLPEPIGLATVDAAFIGLRLLLPAMTGWLEPSGELIALVKPQFEAGRSLVGRGGVVKDPIVHRRVLTEVIESLPGLGLQPQGLIRSPLIGPKGNVEFLLWAARTGPTIPGQELLALVFPA